MANELMEVKFESLSGIMVQLDAATVRNTLTRGNGNVSDQEVAMFLRTCQAKKLDPLTLRIIVAGLAFQLLFPVLYSSRSTSTKVSSTHPSRRSLRTRHHPPMSFSFRDL